MIKSNTTTPEQLLGHVKTTPSSHAFSDDEFADVLGGLSLENFLSDSYLPDKETELNAENPVASVVPSFSKTIEIEGKSYLKGLLVAGLSSNRSKKVTMCTLCVQGIALEDLRPKSKFEDLAETLDDNDELVLCLARLGLKALALAWPEAALAFSNPRPGQSHETWLGSSLARPRLWLLYVKCKKKLLQIGLCTGELLGAIYVLVILILN
jgi:hypothetical protein